MNAFEALEAVNAYYEKYSFLAAKSPEKEKELTKLYEAICTLKVAIETNETVEFQLRNRISDANFQISLLQNQIAYLHAQIFGEKRIPPRNFQPNYENERENFNRNWISEQLRRDNV